MAEPEKETRVSSEPAVDHGTDTSTAVQLAHDVDNNVYSPWTPAMFRLYMILIIAYLCGCLNGYDGSLMGGLNGMTSYQKYFHM
jgi:hypothetical protein